MTLPSLTPAAKRDIKKLEAAGKLLGRVAFLLGETGSINAMVEVAKADAEIELRIGRIRATCK